MKYRLNPVSIGLLYLLLVVAVGCQPDDNQLCNPAPKFNIDLYIQNIEAGLTDVAGFEFAVNQGGNLYYSNPVGFSIYASDPGGPIGMTADTRMNVASVSKFIGTIALMQVLEDHNIDIDQPIHNYLPDEWKTVTHTDHFDAGSPFLIRFKNLLRMETALPFTGTNWSPGIMPTTQEMVRALVQPAAANRWGVYQNGNFTLIRVLIGEIEFNLDENDPNYDQTCSDKYFEYIKQHIFDPLNLNPPMSVDAVNNYYQGAFTRAHQWPFDDTFRDGNNNVGWGATSNPANNGGSGGLVLSVIDLAKILAFFRHDDGGTIISSTQRDRILENELGLIESMTGSEGRYQSKGGTRGPENGPARALRSRVIFYPNGVEAVLLINSNYTNMATILRDSYDNAWVSGC